ncbi:MAG: hypothetical protein OHM77_09865 [Candidatus Nitricoxidivorans perseverans]|uniref:Uncharacterized protein n=1 Tax=Candidatus Nitricoxidivorans perseverans TaxID=2975601 RepID=A0AA49FJS7_9PROT|nr:MAG: hypothetical protein OHM77_09865 [Candidatus Nitricoxidivorans perseverans]
MNHYHDATTGQASELKPYRELSGTALQMNLLHLNVPLPVSAGKDKIEARVINLRVENVKLHRGIAAPQFAGEASYQAMNKNVLDIGRTLGKSFAICG